MHPSDLVAERFEIQRAMAAGGMATVWQARDRVSGEMVAVKVLHSHAEGVVGRFEREAVLLAELRHPGVVRYLAHGTTVSGEPYIAMEWLEGEDLRTRLKREGLTVAETIALLRRLAETLAVVHARGIVHRDIKPGNVFLVDGDIEHPKLLDFGIARLDDATYTRTKTGMLVGTPGFMAPEQARGESDVDARADVFALGCVAFACLTGRPPFAGDNAMAALAKILIEDTPRVRDLAPHLPEGVDQLVAAMMAKQPHGRPRDAAALVEAIDGLGVVAPGGDRPSGRTVQPASLTDSEQRFVSVIACLAPGRSQEDTATLVEVAASVREEQLRNTAAMFGAHLERLLDGSIVAWVVRRGAATDQAMHSARCALALHAVVPDAPIALATGHGVLSDRFPVGDAIDRASSLAQLALGRAKERPAMAGGVLLDDLTAGLLDARFDVQREEGGAWLRGVREGDRAPRTVLGRRIRCLGRDRELALLQGVFDECVGEPASRVVLVTGPAGMGKSRLVDEAIARIDARPGVEVWLARADPMRAGSPFAMIGQALRAAARVLDGEDPAARREKLRARVARHVAPAGVERVSIFIGELAGVSWPPEQNVELQAARADPRMMSDRIQRAFEALLAAECAAHPLLIVLDDLHWGDLPTVKLIDGALRALPDVPLMVVGTARPEIRDLFPGLWAERAPTDLRLGGISRRASERLVREALGDAADSAVLDRVVELGAGNAFFLEELVRAVAEGRAASLPETVLAMVEARLDALEPQARRILRAASVFGQTFWERAVEALVREPPGEWLDVLVERELVERRADSRFPGEREIVFRHALLREAAYAMLTASDRSLGHRIAAQWLTDAREGDALLLAEHFERGGDRAQAAPLYRRAAEHALDANDLRGVIERAERGLAAGADGELRGELYVLEAEAHKWLGDHKAAGERAEAALELLGRDAKMWFRAMVEALSAASRQGRRTRTAELCAAVFEASRGIELGAAHVLMLARAAQSVQTSDQPDLAVPLLELIDTAPPRVLAEPSVAGRVWQAQAQRLQIIGDVGGSIAKRRLTLDAFVRAGDDRNEVMARHNLGYALMRVGLYEEAEVELRAARDAAEALGLQYSRATAQNNLSLAIALRGRLDEAITGQREAIEALSRHGDRRMEGGSRVHLAAMLARAGQLGEAEVSARTATEVLPPDASLMPYALATLAHVLLLQGRSADALETATEARQLLAARGSVEDGEALVRLVYAEALEANGAAERAREALAEALTRLRTQLGTVTEDRMRDALVHEVPEHARTFALAKAWGVAAAR